MPTKAARFSWSTAFLLLPGLLCAAMLVRWPIVALDTDLWYHLRAGAHILAQGLPQDAFFSFLEPPRAARDYSWLFQAVAALVHGAAGFRGLILLRAAAFAGTFAFLFALVRRRGEGAQPYGCLLLGLMSVLLFHRFVLVRPHMAEYLLLAAALWLLEERPDWAPALPALGLLWGNLHGVSYPVWLLVLGAYALDPAFARRRPWLLAAAAAVFATPLGSSLPALPFLSRDFARGEILELRAIGLRELIAFPLREGAPTFRAASNALLWLSLGAAGLALRRRSARPTHLVLLAGGLVLLTEGSRLRYEAALLAWPLLCATEPPAPRQEAPVWGLELLTLAGLLLPLLAFRKLSGDRPHYPLSTRNLPAGVTAFLNREGPGGRVLNYPSKGGFYEWELYPRYRIAMDLQVPFLFTDEDLFEVSSAYRDPRVLADLLERYRPDFIAAPAFLERFRAVIADFPDFVPVFLDDAEILFVDRRLHPELARRWALPVDPYEPLPEPGPGAAGRGCGLPSWLSRLIAVDPRCLKTRLLAARYCLAGGDPRTGLAHAEAVVENFPELAIGRLTRIGARLALQKAQRSGRAGAGASPGRVPR